MSGNSFDDKERVRQATDIVDLLSGYLQLRRQGNLFVASCPWHDDKRPSLQINPARQSWKCWPCDIGGDVFSFVMRREGVDFAEALKILADRAGIELTRRARPAPQGSPGDKQTLYQAMDWVARQYHHYLREAADANPARLYLRQREVTEASIEKFQIGFAPNQWTWLVDRAKTTPFSQEVLHACGLTKRGQDASRHYDAYRGRIIFPIHDIQNRPIGMGGRILPSIAEDNPDTHHAKYINSPETRLFSKSDNLYGLNVHREASARERHLIVVEGYTDVVAAWQAGLSNVVAALGTAFNQRHLHLVRRYADRVTLVLDGDDAGRRRANDILEIFVAADVDLRILTLPDQMDPCDFLNQRGSAPFIQLVESANDALAHRIQVETEGIDLVNETHRANQALEKILGTMARASYRKQSSASKIREQQLLMRLSRQFQIEGDQIRRRLREIRGVQRVEPVVSSTSESTPKYNVASFDPKEKELLEILLQDFSFLNQVAENISIEQFVEGAPKQIYGIFCECYQNGRDADFNSIMTEIDDPQLKSVLVSLDEEAQRKTEKTDFDTRERLNDVIQAFKSVDLDSINRQAIARLQTELDDQEETSTLEEILERARQRQGLSAPTDG